MKILQQCTDNNQGNNNHSCKNELLLWKNWVVIPATNSLIQLILNEYHDNTIGGHSGVTKTVEKYALTSTSQTYRKIKNYVQSCIVCQKAKFENKLSIGLLHPLSIPSQVWEAICMDFIALHPSHDYFVIMVVIDHLSKFAQFIPLKKDFTSKTIVEAFVQHIVKLHGFPKTIVSDRDKVFISRFWQQLLQAQKTKLVMSSTYHLETDDQSKVLNKTLEMYLYCLCYNNLKS